MEENKIIFAINQADLLFIYIGLQVNYIMGTVVARKSCEVVPINASSEKEKQYDSTTIIQKAQYFTYLLSVLNRAEKYVNE